MPAISSSAFNGSGLLAVPFGDPVTATQSGVVVAVSTNNLQNAGAAGAGAGTVAVAIAGAVVVHNINTTAAIDPGASVTSGDNIVVAAGRTYNELTLGLGAAGSGTFSAAPGIAVPVLSGTTSATITGDSTDHTLVHATGDIGVTAVARENIVVIAVGFAVSGVLGVAGSAAVIDVNTTTEALISGATGDTSASDPVTVTADGNILVSALHDATGYAIAGAFGIGLGGGGGAGAVALTLSGNTTEALIQNGARVDADANSSSLTDVFGNSYQGVGVQADSSHTVGTSPEPVPAAFMSASPARSTSSSCRTPRWPRCATARR